MLKLVLIYSQKAHIVHYYTEKYTKEVIHGGRSLQGSLSVVRSHRI